MRKRFLSILLVFCLCLNILPAMNIISAVALISQSQIIDKVVEAVNAPKIIYHANYPEGVEGAGASTMVDAKPKSDAAKKKGNVASSNGFFEGPTFDGAYEEENDDDSFCYRFTAPTVEQAGFTVDGYEFAGWNSTPDATFAIWQGGDEVHVGDDGMELYAVWSEIVPYADTTFTINYFTGNGGGSTYTVRATSSGATYNFNMVTDSEADATTTNVVNYPSSGSFSAPTGYVSSGYTNTNGLTWLGWSERNSSGAKPGESGDAYAFVDYFSLRVINNLSATNFNIINSVQRSITLTTQDPTLNLYAVWGFQAVQGYALSIENAYFADDVHTINGEKPIYYANTAGGARKYIAANGGYENATGSATITVGAPVHPDKSKVFMGWYDKNGGDTGNGSQNKYYFSLQGDEVMRSNAKVSSNDAMWGTISSDGDALERTVEYDTKPHTLKLDESKVGIRIAIDGLGGDEKTKPEAARIEDFYNAITPSFSLEVRKKVGNQYETVDGIVTGEPLEKYSIDTYEEVKDGKLYYVIDYSNVENEIRQIRAGEYEYVFTPTLTNAWRNNTSHELDPIYGKLTITPVTLTFEKSISVSATPGEKFDFKFGYGASATAGVNAVNVTGLLDGDYFDVADFLASMSVTAPSEEEVTETTTYKYTSNCTMSGNSPAWSKDGSIDTLDLHVLSRDNSYNGEKFNEAVAERSYCYVVKIVLNVTVTTKKINNFGFLTIEEEGGQPHESFLYRVTNEDGTVDIIVSVKGGGSTTILVPLGTYTVTEISDWSWRYENEQTEGRIGEWVTSEENLKVATTTLEEDGEQKIVTYYHKQIDKTWVGGEKFEEYWFN